MMGLSFSGLGFGMHGVWGTRAFALLQSRMS